MKDISLSRLGLFLALIVFAIVGLINNKNTLDREEKLSLSQEVTEKEEIKEEIKEDIKAESPKKDIEVSPKEEAFIYVHVSGAVNKEGLYKLQKGSRLDDLVKACGGLKKNADMMAINLSMLLEDEMRLHIPLVGENANHITETLSPKEDGKKSAKINVNDASIEELMELPGVGEKRASDIIEYREKEKFKSLEDLKNVKGIGDKSLEQLKDLVEFK